MFREIYDTVDAGLCVIEMKFNAAGAALDYRFVEINDSFAKQTGIENGQGRWMREIAPNHEQYWFDLYGEVAKTGKPIKIENRAEALNRWFEAQAFRVGAPDDNLVTVFFKDITERKLTELSLRDSELQFRTLAEAMPNHVWTADTKGMLDWLNPRIIEYSGLSNEELLGDKWATIVHPDDLAGAGERWATAIESGKGYETEFRLRRRDGDYRWHLARAVAIADGNGKIVRWIGTNTDIHDQKQTTEALRETATRLRLAQKAGAIGTLEINFSSNEVIGSDMFWELWGLPESAQSSLSTLQEIILPQDRDLFNNICEQTIADLEDEISFRIQRPSDGKVRWLAIRTELFADETSEAQKLVGVVRDVTSHKDAEARQDMLTHELVHRIKNILSSVSAIASQTFRHHDYETAKSTFSERLISLSKAHEVLTRNDWQQTTILEITQICLSHLEDDRIIIDGPEIVIPSKAVTTLALAINELATNSAKYGALSVPEGQVKLSWKTHMPDGQTLERLHWSWVESNGPEVQPPTRKGFGTFLIERALAADFSGVVQIDYIPAGLCCTLDAPLPETAKSKP